jgi:hypothetical protein
VQRVGRLRVDLPKLQARLAQMLRDIATHTATALTRGANVGVAKTRYVEVKRFFRIAFETVDDCGILRLSATVDQEGDDVLYATLLLLDEVGRDRIALCAAADCAHLVLRHKKRLFCSDNCYMRDYMRRYRDNDYLPPRKRGKAKGASRGKPTRAR